LLIFRPNGFKNDNTTEQEQQREQELDQAWDFLISGALEAMRKPERRQWVADQMKEEELRMRWEVSARHDVPDGSWVDQPTEGVYVDID
jgi:hypothetical protein